MNAEFILIWIKAKCLVRLQLIFDLNGARVFGLGEISVDMFGFRQTDSNAYSGISHAVNISELLVSWLAQFRLI